MPSLQATEEVIQVKAAIMTNTRTTSRAGLNLSMKIILSADHRYFILWFMLS